MYKFVKHWTEAWKIGRKFAVLHLVLWGNKHYKYAPFFVVNCSLPLINSVTFKWDYGTILYSSKSCQPNIANIPSLGSGSLSSHSVTCKNMLKTRPAKLKWDKPTKLFSNSPKEYSSISKRRKKKTYEKKKVLPYVPRLWHYSLLKALSNVLPYCYLIIHVG